MQQAILIISPQPWNHIPVSKHNYAMALARRGHRVVFLNPPQDSLLGDSACEVVPGHPGVRVLSYRRPWFYRLRFHVPRIHDWLLRRHVTGLLRRYHCAPDLVWCFDFNLLGDLSRLGADRSIFHPVDPLSDRRHLQPARTADLVLTVSSRIAGQLAASGREVHVVNHGLAAPFEQLGRETLSGLNSSSMAERGGLCRSRHRVGYAGNLGRRPVNRAVLRQIVAENPQVDFHFWGPAEANSGAASEFIAYLIKQSNVTLHGAVSQHQLAEGFRTMDAFLLSYAADPTESDRSNSHKILEYLSTGKVVVSSRIQAYEDQAGLLMMSASETDADLPEIFAETIARLDEKNSVELQKARIEVALENSYDRQIDRIFALLNAASLSASAN